MEGTGAEVAADKRSKTGRANANVAKTYFVGLAGLHLLLLVPPSLPHTISAPLPRIRELLTGCSHLQRQFKLLGILLRSSGKEERERVAIDWHGFQTEMLHI